MTVVTHTFIKYSGTPAMLTLHWEISWLISWVSFSGVGLTGQVNKSITIGFLLNSVGCQYDYSQTEQVSCTRNSQFTFK